MPITIVNHPMPNTDHTSQAIEWLIEHAGRSNNPSHVTLIHSATDMTGEEFAEIERILQNTQYDIAPYNNTYCIAFTGKKPALDQKRLVCFNEFLRTHCENYVRVGKKPNTADYNAYQPKQVVQNIE